MTRIFISYRRKDSEGYAGRLSSELEKYYDKREIFLDAGEIQPGEDFVDRLEQGVRTCEALIAVIGPRWVNIRDSRGRRRLLLPNDYVRLEVGDALKRNILVIPALVERACMPSSDELPDDLVRLARRNAIELSHDRFDYDVKRMVDAMGGAYGVITVFPLLGSFVPLHSTAVEGVYEIRVDGRIVGKIQGPKLGTLQTERQKGWRAAHIEIKQGVHTIRVDFRSSPHMPGLRSNELRFNLKGGQHLQFRTEYGHDRYNHAQLRLKHYRPVIET